VFVHKNEYNLAPLQFFCAKKYHFALFGVVFGKKQYLAFINNTLNNNNVYTLVTIKKGKTLYFSRQKIKNRYHKGWPNQALRSYFLIKAILYHYLPKS